MEGNKCHVLPALTKVSFIIARHLDSENLYTQFLTSSESQIFKDAVTNFDKWSLFIKATDKFDDHSVNGSDDSEPKETSDRQMSDEQVAAFRVRAMIFDQLVPQLYQCSKPCCSHSNAIRDIIQGFSDEQFEKFIESLDQSAANHQPEVDEPPKEVEAPSNSLALENTSDANEDNLPPGTHAFQNTSRYIWRMV
jgi:hypothetical protein